ncbi:SDR family oxidoreductase [Antrihabitans sp. YC3-6]|uniref:SDR family oxidoreductase n=1 Tax=Antrihabitans stalagmiti TaxID=2799499 RepID=A0A934U3S8_9NOCA|nr:SDR family oxidoreductase [Antrihabitans stalagmiti]MBJ8339767.1 SDR family oxidoreductase [Antrihabitans stalagmiti]
MASKSENLNGRIVAITGGARGIGKATAKALVDAGARVAIGDLDSDLAAQTASEIGGGTIGLPLDVTDRDSFEGFVAAAEAALGALDVLINNAGIMPVGRFVEEDDATARRLVDINIHGVLYGMKIVLPRFVERGSGHLINIASAAGKAGFPGVATYSGTKHFVVGVSEAARLELRGTGVEVSCVMPNIVNTDLGSGIGHARFIPKSEPEDVAAEIVSAVRKPHFDVYVPPLIGPINKIVGVLPRAGREGIARLLKADTVILDVDWDQRKTYEDRASKSDPLHEEH